MGLPEDVLHFFERFGEHVDLPTGVVEAHRRPRRGRHAEPLHQRLRAVVADADGDALALDDGAEVVRMDAVWREGEIGRASGRARGCQYGEFSVVEVSVKKKK